LKDAVLRILKQSRPKYLSGEEICKILRVTRTAVWKQIQSLRQEGYEIDARPRAGYLLLAAPDKLYPEEIGDNLATRFIGREIYYCESVPSTNDLAKELAQKGVPEGTLVVVEEQTGGRGRLGRVWHSPSGEGLWFSLVFRPPVTPARAFQMTILAAVALAEAIRIETGLPAGIKWPNDLLVDGKKLCGILTEMSAEMERVNHMVLGVGINVNQDEGDFPVEVRQTATSLLLQGGGPLSRVNLLRNILASLERWYDRWIEEGFQPVLARWKDFTVTLGRPVRIHSMSESWEGWAEDVDDEGALILRLPDGSHRRVISGEVSLRLDGF